MSVIFYSYSFEKSSNDWALVSENNAAILRYRFGSPNGRRVKCKGHDGEMEWRPKTVMVLCSCRQQGSVKKALVSGDEGWKGEAVKQVQIIRRPSSVKHGFPVQFKLLRNEFSVNSANVHGKIRSAEHSHRILVILTMSLLAIPDNRIFFFSLLKR